MSRLVFIEWLDSHQTAGWTTDEPPSEPLLVESVGWLVHDGAESKTLAAHITVEDAPQRAGQMTIPTCAIRKIADLTYAGKPDS